MAKNKVLILICVNVFLKLCCCDDDVDDGGGYNALDVRHTWWPNVSDYNDELGNNDEDNRPKHISKPFWQTAVVPFYIENEHYDHAQTLQILKALSTFHYKTCIHFTPVMARPQANQHVLLFENPKGIRTCIYNQRGHSVDEPHILLLGYDCLTTPDIDMAIMRALGFPFEHNNAKRDDYIDVRQENLIPSAINLFQKDLYPMWTGIVTKDNEYDYNSVMHFPERAFSKNGHKTIVFKDKSVVQDRSQGLSKKDLLKIDTVYKPYCRRREHREKIELCQTHPTRAKREIAQTPKSFRVNPNITPPPDIANQADNLTTSLHDLGIDKEVQEIVDLVNKASALALSVARARYCNGSGDGVKAGLRAQSDAAASVAPENPVASAAPAADILGIITKVNEYTQSMVAHAVANLTEFCEVSHSIEQYQRARAACPFYDKSRCVQTNFKSTKSGPVKYSTQHRPVIKPSTKHKGAWKEKHFVPLQRAREDNETDAVEAEPAGDVTGVTGDAGVTEAMKITGAAGARRRRAVEAGSKETKAETTAEPKEVKAEKKEEPILEKKEDVETEKKEEHKVDTKEHLQAETQEAKLEKKEVKGEVKLEDIVRVEKAIDAATKGNLRMRTVLLTKPPVLYAPDN